MTQNRFFKKSIKNVLIIYRGELPDIIQIVRQSEHWFKKRKISTHSFSQSSLLKKPFLDSDIDLVVVLGGDGTYLQAVQYISNYSVPFLGINMGSFGFLTVHKQDSLVSCLESVVQGNMILEERSLIDVSFYQEDNQKSEYLALNDMVIERGNFSHLIDISITIQNANIYSVKADGIIISSPTGSTAYNLAAGGPILHPQVNSFAITPICSHSLTNRPVIVPDNYEMLFKVNNHNQSAFLTIDGKKQAQISNKHSIKMRKSNIKHLTLRHINHNDFLLLKDKLKFSQ
ncbi:MAG: NAD(+)/NADH kinase [Bdellovibrionales bacterium]|nr:NAD(+)/NADH kinase [Bdellovibrionales bacterium]